MSASSPTQSAIGRGGGFWKILAWAGLLLAGALYMLDPVAGVSKDAVKIVVLRNRLPNEDHAVVAVRIDDQWLILDNRTLTLVRDMDVRRAIPEFVLDDPGVSRFVWSGRNRKVVS